jgi:hypothetical protein
MGGRRVAGQDATSGRPEIRAQVARGWRQLPEEAALTADPEWPAPCSRRELLPQAGRRPRAGHQRQQAESALEARRQSRQTGRSQRRRRCSPRPEAGKSSARRTESRNGRLTRGPQHRLAPIVLSSRRRAAPVASSAVRATAMPAVPAASTARVETGASGVVPQLVAAVRTASQGATAGPTAHTDRRSRQGGPATGSQV